MPHCKMNEVMMDTAGVICQVQPRLNWDFTVNKSRVSTLKARATKFLKKLIGLAKAADPSQTAFTKITRRPAIYRKPRASVARLLLTSPDPVVQPTAKLAIRKEESLCRPIHQPMLEVREIWQHDPGTSRKSLLKRAKAQFAIL